MNQAFIDNYTDVTEYVIYGLFDVKVLYQLMKKVQILDIQIKQAELYGCSILEAYTRTAGQQLTQHIKD